MRRGLQALFCAAGIAAAAFLLMSLADSREASLGGRVDAATQEGAGSTIAASAHVLVRHTGSDDKHGKLSMASTDGRRTDRVALALTCDRVSYAAGRGICLAAKRGIFISYKAVLFDRDFKATRTIALDGSPSRTRISADGRVGAITVFVRGQAHGYAGLFSTKTTILDMANGDILGDLEQFATFRDGARFKAADFNFWGVTFARNSNVFYASLRSGGATFLVRGDLGLRTLTVLRDNVECPSLSPDNRRIAFKKRVRTDIGTAWRLYVLDLASMSERPIVSETRSVDDQVEWLDDTRVLYALPRKGSATTDVWVAAADGDAPPRVFLADAESPIVLR
jgi:hypothetical protein